MLLTTAAGSVLLGTLYPLFIDALGLGKVSVGPPFFNIVFVPLMVPLIAAMAIGPMLSWKRGDLPGAWHRLRFAFTATLARHGWHMADRRRVAYIARAACGLGLAAWLLTGTLSEWAGRVRLFQVPFTETVERRAICRAAPMA